MIVKKKAIRFGFKFYRINLNHCKGGFVCTECKYESSPPKCKICNDVFLKTGVNSYAISYSYYIPKR